MWSGAELKELRKEMRAQSIGLKAGHHGGATTGQSFFSLSAADSAQRLGPLCEK